MIGRTSEIGKDGISGRPTPGDGWVKKKNRWNRERGDCVI